MSKELNPLPCPFCGDDALLLGYEDDENPSADEAFYCCRNDDCAGVSLDASYDNWNQRDTSKLDALTEQLAAKDAYIEELRSRARKNFGKLIAICGSNQSAAESKILAEVAELLQSTINQSPTTSLEQVKREAEIQALKDYDACLSSFPVTVEEYIANNLKEKG